MGLYFKGNVFINWMSEDKLDGLWRHYVVVMIVNGKENFYVKLLTESPIYQKVCDTLKSNKPVAATGIMNSYKNKFGKHITYLTLYKIEDIKQKEPSKVTNKKPEHEYRFKGSLGE